MLARQNPHPRDEFISFEEEDHIYTIKGVEGHPVSVTTLIHLFFVPFDADVVIDKMMASRNWPHSEYFGMTKESIKQQWETNRDEAAKAGTAMHKSIEEFLNRPEEEQLEVCKHFLTSGSAHSSVPQTKEFFYFLCFWNDLDGDYKPYRTEWLVYDADKRLSGSIDLVLQNTMTGKFVIIDWKRSKQIKRSNRYQSGSPPWSHLEDCNWNHYSLQLNIYRYLLETHYGKEIEEMFLVVLHPNAASYELINVPRMQTEIENVMKILPLPESET